MRRVKRKGLSQKDVQRALAAYPSPGSSEWERLCAQCGRCCYEKVDDGQGIYYLPEPCDKLDLTTRLCTVYGRRHLVRPDCLPITHRTIAAGILPADCPYVRAIEQYPAPVLDGQGDADNQDDS
jgi:uncharacterized cysteine cluster protein YcgN (CxxCxxCC family)